MSSLAPPRILGRRRLAGLACLALLAPMPALALDGGEPAMASIAVNAGLSGCGLMDSRIVCTIDASWSEVEGADRYTASVVAPDGSVTDAGEVGAGGTTIWVPYVGDGTYSVRVAAYGDPDRDGADEPVAVGSSGGSATGVTGASGVRGADGGGAGGSSVEPAEPQAPEEPTEPADPGTTTPEETVPPETTVPEETVPPEPVCTEPTPEQIAEREAIEAERQALIDEARANGEPEPTFEALPPLEPVCEPAG